MTIYNEVDFVDYAIRSCLPYVDNLIIVEGAYRETIDIGGSPRSNDGTLDIVDEYLNKNKIHFIQSNEQTDKDQRNVGLEIVKKLNTDWLLIIDGDEVYEPHTFKMIKNLCKQFEKSNTYAAYFQSLTFINNFDNYTTQEFPRLFKVTPNCTFINDNFMQWKNVPNWSHPYVVKVPQIKYFHYAFCKSNKERFLLKKKWWETRFGTSFDYGWKIENNKITDNNHKILTFKKKHPIIMKSHPLYSQRKY
jgi:hypothetical protein